MAALYIAVQGMSRPRIRNGRGTYSEGALVPYAMPWDEGGPATEAGHSPAPSGRSPGKHRSPTGALFLNELQEFPRSSIESLRQPMEEGAITVARAGGAVTFPASFSLVAAMNPCRCGYRGETPDRCRCRRKRCGSTGRMSRVPILDRIDLTLEVPALTPEELLASQV